MARAADTRRLPRTPPIPASEQYGSTNPEWLRIDWQPCVHDLELESGPVRYVDYGSGPRTPVVLIHGLSANWQHWLEQIPVLGATRRVLALDLPGFGESPLREKPLSIRGDARLLEEFCEILGAEPCVLVGNSMGGFVAAEMAISHPRRVDKLVLVSAAGLSTTKIPTIPRVSTAVAARGLKLVNPVIKRIQDAGFRRQRLRYFGFRGAMRHPRLIRPELLYELARGTTAEGLAPAITAITGYDYADRLEEIEVPTLVMWGCNDLIVSVGDADRYAGHITDSRTVLFDDTGHLPMVERPARFNRELLAFLDA
ncbi:MAG: alpha/beta fold hydrolase [Solirubrobacterales bacterium]